MLRFTIGSCIVLGILCLAFMFTTHYAFSKVNTLKLENSRITAQIDFLEANIKRDSRILTEAIKSRDEAVKTSQGLRKLLEAMHSDETFNDWSNSPLPSGLLDTVRP